MLAAVVVVVLDEHVGAAFGVEAVLAGPAEDVVANHDVAIGVEVRVAGHVGIVLELNAVLDEAHVTEIVLDQGVVRDALAGAEDDVAAVGIDDGVAANRHVLGVRPAVDADLQPAGEVVVFEDDVVGQMDVEAPLGRAAPGRGALAHEDAVADGNVVGAGAFDPHVIRLPGRPGERVGPQAVGIVVVEAKAVDDDVGVRPAGPVHGAADGAQDALLRLAPDRHGFGGVVAVGDGVGGGAGTVRLDDLVVGPAPDVDGIARLQRGVRPADRLPGAGRAEPAVAVVAAGRIDIIIRSQADAFQEEQADNS